MSDDERLPSYQGIPGKGNARGRKGGTRRSLSSVLCPRLVFDYAAFTSTLLAWMVSAFCSVI